MDNASKEAILSSMRTLFLAPLGTWIATNGYSAGATAETVTGALVILATALWGIYDKFQAERKTKDREAVAVLSTIEAVKADPNQIDVPVLKDDVQRIIKDFNPSNGNGKEIQK